MVEHISNNFDELIKTSDKLVIVDFWAEWCGPCRMVSPIMEELSEHYSDKVIIGKCNVDENPQIAAKLGLRNIPVVMLFKNGVMVDRVVGAVTKNIYINRINTQLQ